jgi:hypothetical protein
LGRSDLQHVHIGGGQQIVGLDIQGGHDLPGLAMTGIGVIAVLQDDFQFDESAQSIDFIEVDAGAAGQVEQTLFLDFGAHAQAARERGLQGGGGGEADDLVGAGLGSRLVGALVLDQLPRAVGELAEFEPAVPNVKEGVVLNDQGGVGGSQLAGEGTLLIPVSRGASGRVGRPGDGGKSAVVSPRDFQTESGDTTGAQGWAAGQRLLPVWQPLRSA